MEEKENGRTLVCFADDPSRRVTDTQVQHFAALHHVVQALHQFWDRCRKVPPVDVEQIDVIRLQFLQASFQGNVQRLGRVTSVVDALAWRRFPRIRKASGELCGQHNLVANVARSHPLPDPRFRFFALVVVCPGGLVSIKGGREVGPYSQKIPGTVLTYR